MIEVTCGACGSTHRYPESDVAPGGKTVSCHRCKLPIAIPVAAKPPMPAIPSPGVSGGTGDVINLADLPAPKRPSPLAGAAAVTPRPGALPPLGGRGIAQRPMAAPPIPAPMKKPSIARSPAPETSPPLELGALDMGALDMDAIDLPAPVGPEPTGSFDLAPVGPTGRNRDDLPAPKRASAPEDFGLDLPVPKRASGPDIGIDLPAPKRPSDLDFDLPAPKRPSGPDSIALDPDLDLPAPKGPTGSNVDLPAPKGFFDDLPRSASTTPSAPAAARVIADLPLPKGPTGSNVDLPAPKGFFDDLPQSASLSSSPGTDLQPVGARNDLPAPKGFFDDLPGARSGGPAPPRSKGLDLDDLDLAPPTNPPVRRAEPIRVAPAAAPPRPDPHSNAPPLELDSMDEVPALELDGPSGNDRFGNLDLPMGPPLGIADRPPPPAASSGVVSFKASAAEPARIIAPVPQSLDLDVDDTRKARSSPRAIEPARAREGAKPQGKDGAAKLAKKLSPRSRLIALVGGLAVVVLGVGGFFYYQHAQKQKSRATQIRTSLAEARKQLADDGPGHWKRAGQAAQAVLTLSAKHDEALALAAIANLAGYLDEGTDRKMRLAAADRAVETMRSAGASGPLADKAIGLHGMLKTDRVGALERLTAVATKNPKDLDAQLFLGWAAAMVHDYPTAITAFKAAAAGKTRTVPATYGLGLAQLGSGDLEGARKSFAAVLAEKKDHIGAQIGSTAAMSSSSDYARRETELLSILGRDDIDKADPRAVALGWALAGDDARRGAHLDTARDRYRKAIALDPDSVPARVGNAEISIAEGRLDEASATLEEVLESAPGDPAASLALADVHLRGGKTAEAAAVLDHLAAASLAPADRGRRSMIEGRLHQAQGDHGRALTSYAAAQAELGDADITPTIAQVALLGTMAADAAKAGNTTLRDELAARAAALLGAFETKAQSDVEMALTLGRAYLSVDNGAAAQKWLEIVLAARKDDIEIRSLLAKALGLQNKTVEMLQRLREAFDLDPTRADIGLDLATRYEAAGQNTDAAAMYAKVLVSPQATLDTRVHAGLFYARIGDFASAAVQGAAILAAEPTNAAGEFLKAEGLFAEGKYPDALVLYKSAATRDQRAARYWDGYGRAAELIGAAQNDSRYKDEALVAYGEAVKIDATMLASQLGRGRLHLERREFAKALEAFEAARVIDPSSADIAYGEGIAYAQLGKKDLAIQWLQKSVKQRPSADAYHTLARLYLDANRSSDAASAYASATKYAQQDERDGKPQVTWLTDDYWQLGELEKDAGHDAAACKAYNAYLSRNPTDQVKVNNVKTQKLSLRCN